MFVVPKQKRLELKQWWGAWCESNLTWSPTWSRSAAFEHWTIFCVLIFSALCWEYIFRTLHMHHTTKQLLPTSAFFFCLDHLFFLQNNILFFGLFSHCSQLVTHLVFLLETLYTLITLSFDKYIRVWLVLACWHSHKSLLVWFVPLLSIRCFRKSIMLHRWILNHREALNDLKTVALYPKPNSQVDVSGRESKVRSSISRILTRAHFYPPRKNF